ncbi:MAG: hypothetical protein Q7T11_06905 [Deltaproteobacteria bacterium]|nr:hypothetical protein [Deltaproteobacteria bacterium]
MRFLTASLLVLVMGCSGPASEKKEDGTDENPESPSASPTTSPKNSPTEGDPPGKDLPPSGLEPDLPFDPNTARQVTFPLGDLKEVGAEWVQEEDTILIRIPAQKLEPAGDQSLLFIPFIPFIKAAHAEENFLEIECHCLLEECVLDREQAVVVGLRRQMSEPREIGLICPGINLIITAIEGDFEGEPDIKIEFLIPGDKIQAFNINDSLGMGPAIFDLLKFERDAAGLKEEIGEQLRERIASRKKDFMENIFPQLPIPQPASSAKPEMIGPPIEINEDGSEKSDQPHPLALLLPPEARLMGLYADSEKGNFTIAYRLEMDLMAVKSFLEGKGFSFTEKIEADSDGEPTLFWDTPFMDGAIQLTETRETGMPNPATMVMFKTKINKSEHPPAPTSPRGIF